MILLIISLILYAYIGTALMAWGLNESGTDIWFGAALFAVWPITMPVLYLYGIINVWVINRRLRKQKRTSGKVR